MANYELSEVRPNVAIDAALRQTRPAPPPKVQYGIQQKTQEISAAQREGHNDAWATF